MPSHFFLLLFFALLVFGAEDTYYSKLVAELMKELRSHQDGEASRSKQRLQATTNGKFCEWKNNRRK